MADASAFPVSFRDPTYASLDAKVTGKLGLPDGLLSSIRENGERTNADQVSGAGARTPYQIIPDTRAQAIKKWGIDPYLSPENAAEVAGLLLKDSLDRSKGDIGTAVSEYHGGTNPANWGPKTKAYVQRVTSVLGDMAPQPAAQSAQPAAGGVQLPGMQGPSTFDTALAQMDAQQAPSKIQQIYQAYESGQMSPQEQQDFEADVKSGKMMLPRGAALKTQDAGPGVGGASPGASAQPVPAGVMQAYQSGQMTPQEMVDFEHDVKAGAWQLPQGTTAETLFGPAHKPVGVLDRVADAVTGNSRKVAGTEALPDWAGMPELNQLSMASAKTGLGTLLSNPQETAQIIQANYPGVQVRQDQKGNYILRSSVDGQEYAIKPGFRVSDIPRAIGGALAFTPAGRAETLAGAALANGATQAAIEATQAATGGNFDKGEVVGATALGAAVPAAARVVGAAMDPLKATVGRVLGRTEPAVADARAAVTPGGASEAGAAPAADPAALPAAEPGMTVPVQMPAGPKVPAGGAAAQPTVEGVAQTARKAAEGSKPALQDLAGAAAPDAETAAAAQRLGIQDHLQPDHVTSSDAYRQVVGVLKSNPTSQVALQEKEGLAKVAERASKLIDEVGGTNDLSAMDASVKQRMQAAHTELSAREDALYQKIRDTLPATTEAPAPNALAFVEQRAKDLGGEKNLSPMEKTILSKLSPKTATTTTETVAADPNKVGLMLPNTAQKVVTQEAKQPTYALLDDVRRDVGRAARQAGPFSDADTGLAKKYYGLLTQDQNAIAHGAGLGDISDAAKAATTARKGMEDDLTSLFGKNLDHSLVPQVSGAMKAASSGDAAKLLAVLKATPDNMKQEVVASGMATVFRNAATRGEMNFTGYAKWYEGLQRNKQAYTAVMSNLPAPARAQLADLYKVSKGISDSLNARIKTGLRSSVLQELQGAPESLATRLFEVAKHAGKGLAADAVGGHGAGLAMGVMSALKGNAKPNAVKAIDELLTSPEFQHLAATAGSKAQPEAVQRFAYSKAFTKFARAVGNPRELSNRERWVLQALQTNNAMH